MAEYIYGFRPKRISGSRIQHDRPTTAFFRTRSGCLLTPLARALVQDYAVSLIAGITAEARGCKLLFAELPQTSGREDYKVVCAIQNQLTIADLTLGDAEVQCAQLRFWKARALRLSSSHMCGLV